MSERINLDDVLKGQSPDTQDTLDLDSVLSPASPEIEDNPLENVEYTGKVEKDALLEAAALESGFKARARREQKRFQDATGTEYYAVICFQTEEQKEATLDLLQVSRRGRKHFQKYIDAAYFIKALNRKIEAGEKLELPPADITYSPLKGDPKLEKLT